MGSEGVPVALSPSMCCFPWGEVVKKEFLMLSSHLPLTALSHTPVPWEMREGKIIPFIPALILLLSFHVSNLWGRNPSISDLLPEVQKFGAAGRACGCGFQALNDLSFDEESLRIRNGMCCDRGNEPSLVSVVIPACI